MEQSLRLWSGRRDVMTSSRPRQSGLEVPCYFPEDSLANTKRAMFMRVSELEFFLREIFPSSFPCAGNLLCVAPLIRTLYLSDTLQSRLRIFFSPWQKSILK